MIQTHVSWQTHWSNDPAQETTSQEDQQISPPTPVVRLLQFYVRKRQPNHLVDLKTKRKTSLQAKTFSPELSKCLYLHTRIRIFLVSPESNNNIPKNMPRMQMPQTPNSENFTKISMYLIRSATVNFFLFQTLLWYTWRTTKFTYHSVQFDKLWKAITKKKKKSCNYNQIVNRSAASKIPLCLCNPSVKSLPITPYPGNHCSAFCHYRLVGIAGSFI